MKRINVNIPPEVLETSRALQAANRERLVRRERDERTKREAERQARKAREEQARSLADPKNRGVPDVEDPPFFPLHRRGQKFKVAGAYCQVRSNGLRVFTPDRQVSTLIPVPELQNNRNYAFPAFVVAMPGGVGRTVLTFCFDTWDYRLFRGRLLGGRGTEKYYGYVQVATTPIHDVLGGRAPSRPDPGDTITEYIRIPFQYIGDTDWFVYQVNSYYYTRAEARRYSSINRIAKRDQLLTDFQNAQIFKSCVVTSNRINVIDTPPAASLFLRSLYPRKDPVIRIETKEIRPAATQTVVTFSIVQEIVPAEPPYLPFGFANATLVTYRAVPSVTETQVPLPAYTEETMFIEYEQENTNFYDRLPLASYGYGYLVNREPATVAASIRASISQAISGRQSVSSITSLNSTPVQPDNRGFATPAVFAFMYKYEGEFDGDNANRSEAMDYKYISDNYFSGRLAGDATDPGPRYMLTVGYQPEGTTIDRTVNLFYFRPPLDTNTFLSPPISLKEGKGTDEERAMAAPPLPNTGRRAFSSLWDWKLVRDMKITGYGDGDIIRVTTSTSGSVGETTAINTWDWGRPLACILELLSLGFSSDALMLTAEELEAVANATPADRFNFSSPP